MKLDYYFQIYNSSKFGLSDELVVKNRKKFGYNGSIVSKTENFVYMFLLQFGSFFSILLFLLALGLLFIGNSINFYVLLFLLIINALVLTIQKYYSHSVYKKNNDTNIQYSRVIRNNKQIKIVDADIVAGDILVVKQGDHIPIHGMIIESKKLRIDESGVFGTSEYVVKGNLDQSEICETNENKNSVFADSFVIFGEATILVTHVGRNMNFYSFFIKNKSYIEEVAFGSFVKKISSKIFFVTLLLAVLILIIGLIQFYSFEEIFQITLALFISSIPESLPIVITFMLALTSLRLKNKSIHFKNSSSLESLINVDTLILDIKKGSMSGSMKVEKLYTFDDNEVYVTGDNSDSRATFVYDNQSILIDSLPDTTKLLENALLGVKRKQDFVDENSVEAALNFMSKKTSFQADDSYRNYIFESDTNFSNENKFHSATYREGNKSILISTGDPKSILSNSSHVLINGVNKKISESFKKLFLSKVNKYSNTEYFVVATSVSENSKVTCLGLIMIKKPVNAITKLSLNSLGAKGICTILMSDEGIDSVEPIAKKIGIKVNSQTTISGDDMNHLTDAQLKNVLLQKNIFTNVTVQQKIRIVSLLKDFGKKIAITAENINNIAALKKTDVTISTGNTSDDIVKKTADIILCDSSFENIVFVIDESKLLFSNIKKVLQFLLSSNFAQISLIMCTLIFALPIPLTVIGILFLNLITDIVLVISFIFEKEYSSTIKTLNLQYRDWKKIIYTGLLMTLISLLVFINTEAINLVYAQTISFLLLIVMQWFNVLNIKAGENSIFNPKNKYSPVFVLMILISIFLTIIVFNSPFLRDVFVLYKLKIIDWVGIVLLASSVVSFEELRKASQKLKILKKN